MPLRLLSVYIVHRMFLIRLACMTVILTVCLSYSSPLRLILKVKMYHPKFFTEKEFLRASPSCHLDEMSEDLMIKLDEARELCEFPFIINSAYRSEEYEKKRGRRGTSSHCKGLAVDLRCSSSYVRFHMLQALIFVGFRRIGVYPTFIHVDIDDDKVSAVWLKDTDLMCGG